MRDASTVEVIGARLDISVLTQILAHCRLDVVSSGTGSGEPARSKGRQTGVHRVALHKTRQDN